MSPPVRRVSPLSLLLLLLLLRLLNKFPVRRSINNPQVCALRNDDGFRPAD
jgi:hypothetical protein